MHQFIRFLALILVSLQFLTLTAHEFCQEKIINQAFLFRITGQTTPDQCHSHQSSFITFLPLQEKLRESDSFKEISYNIR